MSLRLSCPVRMQFTETMVSDLPLHNNMFSISNGGRQKQRHYVAPERCQDQSITYMFTSRHQFSAHDPLMTLFYITLLYTELAD